MAARNRKIKQNWILFIVTFFVSLIVVTYFIKSFSPNVDVEIGGEHKDLYTTEENTDSDVKQAIDDRLKWIQLEDNMPGAVRRDDAQDEIENQLDRVRNPEKISKNKNTNELEEIEYTGPQHQSTLTPPIPAAPNPAPPKMSKVYVGSYATIEQAIQAQNKLMNSSASVSPFVKEINGVYVLQAGSYANAATADSIAKEINALGFPARVVKE